MHAIANAIVPAGKLSMMFGQNMLKDVKASDFARLATGKSGKVQSNHPAWVFGHLATYVPRVLGMVGSTDVPPFNHARFDELFKNGTECRDDAEGTIYPKMDEIVAAWSSGYSKLMEVLPTIPDEVFMKANPAEGRMKELFPTVGAMCSFMIAAHPMSHFGQVSAWRRFMGLPSAM